MVEYAFIPASGPVDLPVIWYQGDIYDFASSLSGTKDTDGDAVQPSNLARSVTLPPGDYVLLVRAIYEIRMFGDPHAEPPTIRFKMDIHLDRTSKVEVIRGLTVLPDVLDGRMVGEWASVTLRASPQIEQAQVLGVSVVDETAGVQMEVAADSWTIWGGQTRPLALHLRQDRRVPTNRTVIQIVISIKVEDRKIKLPCDLKLQHHSPAHCKPFMITFASPSEPRAGQSPALVSFAMVVPPKSSRTRTPSDKQVRRAPPVMLALHGAGVDIRNPFWWDAIPDRPHGWAVLPQGKTEWGEDWHGGSMDDAWAARTAVEDLVGRMLHEKLSKETL